MREHKSNKLKICVTQSGGFVINKLFYPGARCLYFWLKTVQKWRFLAKNHAKSAYFSFKSKV
jgi:hypothetical protein